MPGSSSPGIHVRCLLLIALFCVSSRIVTAQTSIPEDTFALSDASKLLHQVNEGLINGRAGRVLSAFDLARMIDGQRFRQQVTAFIAHTESIRTHFNLTEATMKDQKGVTVVEAEMEADLRDGNTPPLHRQATLQFVAEHTPAGWKFIDVQPRSFFSISPAAGRSRAVGSVSQ